MASGIAKHRPLRHVFMVLDFSCTPAVRTRPVSVTSRAIAGLLWTRFQHPENAGISVFRQALKSISPQQCNKQI